MKFIFMLAMIFSVALADLVIETIEVESVESNLLLSEGIQDGERLQPDGQVHSFLDT